ncbi:hypothetical protein C5S29_07395 [ANME-1 cluster archaeon GoMg3.2]|nr:hypothetical protein [ANME-1 cluster archaeon GoMg3.2]
MPEKNIVGIAKVKHPQNKSEIKSALFNLLDQMREKGKIKIPSNANIMIKPNICLVRGYETGVSVDPFIVKCLIDWLLQNYDLEAITIGEADATELNVEVAFKVLGWEEMFKEYPNVRLLNLTKDERVKVDLNGLYFENLKMPKSYMESDFLISVAKLKTHTMTGITCNLKNLYGANPIKNKVQYHPHLDEVICDLNKVRSPDFCLVDGIIAMEGAGPVSGIPNPLGLLIAGNNAVASDHACARIIGFNPNKISHLKLAVKQKLGSTDYGVFGERIEDVRTKFEFVPRWKTIVTGIYQNKFINRIPLWKRLLLRIFGV